MDERQDDAVSSEPARFEVLDERFRGFDGDDRVERLFTGCRWAEGPVYVPAGRYLLWSDIPNDRILRWDEPTGQVGVFRQPAGYTNGHTLDRAGPPGQLRARRPARLPHRARRLDHRPRRPLRGQAAQQPQRRGRQIRRLDLVHRPRLRDRQRTTRATGPNREIGACNVYRVDPATGARAPSPPATSCAPTASPSRPTSAASTSSTPAPSHIRAFDVADDGTLSGGEVFATSTAGLFDGLRLDTDGRVWTSADDGVHCYDPDGTLLGKVLVPEPVANVAFGGPKRNRLFIVATSLYSLLKVNGALYP